MSDRPKVLVKEKIGDSGIELLKQHFDVEALTASIDFVIERLQ